jgi:hypothetical protein
MDIVSGKFGRLAMKVALVMFATPIQSAITCKEGIGEVRFSGARQWSSPVTAPWPGKLGDLNAYNN